MEIASASSDGKSPMAFPDVCFSPPTPPVTGAPIPYANTCYAKDITNGSTSVFIAVKCIAQEDKSYFSKSVGDSSAINTLTSPGVRPYIGQNVICKACRLWLPGPPMAVASLLK